LKIIESDNLGGSPPSGDRVTAYCPHCSTPVGQGVVPPWPPNPFVCPTCERHIGRNRAATEPAPAHDGAAVQARAEADDGGRRRGRRGRARSFLLGRPGEGNGQGTASAPAPYTDSAANVEPDEYDDEGVFDDRDAYDDEPASATAAAARAAVGEGFGPEGPGAGDEEREPANGNGSAFRAVAVQVAASRLARPPRARVRAARKVRHAAEVIPRPTRRQRAAKATRDGAQALKRRLLALRITGIALLVFGILVISWALTTLLWKDPFTSLQTARSQKVVGAEFEKLAKEFRSGAAEQTRRERRAAIAREAARMNLGTAPGNAVGKLYIPKIDLDFTIVQGTDEASLQKGPGHYYETPLPGAKGKWTVGIAGHRTTYEAPFRNIDQLKPKNVVRIQMPYALFKYEVVRTKIVDAGETEALAVDSEVSGADGLNQVALTACHPPGSAAQRIIVYAKLNKVVPARKLGSS
jgi:sortase A